MTDQELKTLSPSALNEAVARKLGHTIKDFPYGFNNYCTNIEAAWEIIQYWVGEGYIFNIQYDPDSKQWHISSIESASADTAPMAISLAFLKFKSKND